MARRALTSLAVVSTLALAACGGSSKPSYCSDADDLKSAVSDLTSVNISQNGVSEVKTAADKVVSSGQKLVTDVKDNFPSQTTALRTSLAALKTTAQQLGDPATAKTALRAMPAEIAAVKTASDGMQSAVKPKCD